MKQKLTPKQRLEMIKEVVENGHSVTSICKKYGISRVAFYNWKKRYEAERSKRKKVSERDLQDKKTKPRKYYRQATKKQEKEVVNIALKNPSFSIKKITEHLSEDSEDKPILGTHGVYNVLCRSNLNTKKKREKASPRMVPALQAGESLEQKKLKFKITPLYKTKPQTEKKDQLFTITPLYPPTGETSPSTDETSPPAGETSPPTGKTSPPVGETSSPAGKVKEPEKIKGKLTASQRLEMIERVVKNKEKVSSVCQEYEISRVVFYRLKKRYNEAPDDEKLRALGDKKRKIKKYWRQTTKEQIKEIKDIVLKNPKLSSHKIARLVSLGNHGVQNVLKRLGLNTYERRLAYQTYGAEAMPMPTPAPAEPIPTPIPAPEPSEPVPEIKPTPALAPQEPVPEVKPALKPVEPIPAMGFAQTFKAKMGAYSLLIFLSLGFMFLFYRFIQMLRYAASGTHIGLVFASVSLVFGMFFFLYSLKYYLGMILVLGFSRQARESNNSDNENQKNGFIAGLFNKINNNFNNSDNNVDNNHNGPGLLSRLFGNGNHKANEDNSDIRTIDNNLDKVELKREPFVSIQLPFYNEKKVANRILTACTNMDYENYEVIVVDDSNDETVQILEKWKKHPRVKVYHRNTRSGFKGGALRQALSGMDKRTEFVIVFDADFIPYPDTIQMFLKHFQAVNNNRDYKESNIAAVQGYQWHVLNKSENWITRGVRTEYSGSYVIERATNEILKNLRQIAGSVYMIRADVLKRFGWGTSITEDFELTLRIYAEGWKVMYTPYIQAPSECVSTLKRLIKQRMRWAEGHSHNIKRMFWKLIKSPYLGFTEKLEVLYLSPYYLQAAFFLIGSITWFLSEAIFKVKLPFWTALWGWSLVFANFLSLPLMNSTGLFLEEGERKDYAGILSFLALCYVIVPFQAYAAVKGFIEKDEGGWFRTPKTGKITNVFNRSQFFRWVGRFFPGSKMTQSEAALSEQYLNLTTANNTFNEFKVKKRSVPFLAKGIIAALLIITITLGVFAWNVPTALADPDLYYLHNNVCAGGSYPNNANSWQLQTSSPDAASDSSTSVKYKDIAGGNNIQFWPGTANRTATGETTGYGWFYQAQSGQYTSGTWTFYVRLDFNTSNGSGKVHAHVYSYDGSSYNSVSDIVSTTISADSSTNTYNFSGIVGLVDLVWEDYLYVHYYWETVTTGKKNSTVKFIAEGSELAGADQPRIITTTFAVPEGVLYLIPFIPFLPRILRRRMKKKKKKNIINKFGIIEKILKIKKKFENLWSRGPT